MKFGEGDLTAIIDFDGIIDAAVDVLALNYVVGKVEVEMLDLFITVHPRQILNVAIDLGAWDAWHKKKLSAHPGGGDSSDGCEGSTPPIDQPAASG